MAAAGPKHKVLGLVSGGKDSCFNLLHCVANGHEVVALATLTPEPGTVFGRQHTDFLDELDSHLYQSVGTDLPPLIAESMGLPHYSRVIKGKSIAQGPEYGDRTRLGQGSGVEGDETEDLYLLLQDVLAQHPDITAISTGAILSTYQRLRIEHVAGRLGLVSLAYLWQAEQLPLLEQMQACGMEVILVKVAGVGLGADLVGKSLWDAMPTLRKLERMYGSHPAGEGGEYETLTLSSPLTRSRLNIIDSEVITTDPEPNLVAYLKIRKAELVPKPAEEVAGAPSASELRRLLGLPGDASGMGSDEKEVLGRGDGEAWLDNMGREALEELAEQEERSDRAESAEVEGAASAEEAISNLALDRDLSRTAGEEEVRFAKRGRWFTVSTSAFSCGDDRPGERSSDVGDQVRSCLDRIKACLSSQSPTLSLPLHATHITLLLPSMSLFPIANAAYIQYFGISPPSRATVAVPLPDVVGIRIEVMGYDDTPLPVGTTSAGSGSARRIGIRSALHVQSMSYWAPANIGPYSQAITVDERIHIAGQIPLIPPTLLLPSKSLSALATSTQPGRQTADSPTAKHVQLQATLAMQHVRKIVTVLRSPSQTGGGWQGWTEGCVAWLALPAGPGGRVDVGREVGVVSKAVRIWSEQMSFDPAMPLLIVRARELPKGAEVEVQMNMHTGRRSDDGAVGGDDEDDEELEPEYMSRGDAATGSRWETYRVSGPAERAAKRGSRAVVFLPGGDPTGCTTAVSKAVPSRIFERAVAVRIYHMEGDESRAAAVSRYLDQLSITPPCMTCIPVLDIHDRHGSSVKLALDIFGS